MIAELEWIHVFKEHPPARKLLDLESVVNIIPVAQPDHIVALAIYPVKPVGLAFGVLNHIHFNPVGDAGEDPFQQLINDL